MKSAIKEAVIAFLKEYDSRLLMKPSVSTLISIFMDKTIKPVWGRDSGGDLGLKVGPLIFIFYKWSEPVIYWREEEKFFPFNDEISKVNWRQCRKGE